MQRLHIEKQEKPLRTLRLLCVLCVPFLTVLDGHHLFKQQNNHSTTLQTLQHSFTGIEGL